MALRVPLPEVALQAGRSSPLQAQGVEPFRDAGAQQMQQLGEGMMSAGMAASKIGGFLEDRLSATRAKEKLNVWDDYRREAENGFKGLVGQPAVDAYKKSVEDLRAKRKEIESSLDGDPLAVDLFSERADSGERETLDDFDRHHFVQARNYETGVTDAAMKNRSNEAVKFAFHPVPRNYLLAKGRMEAEVAHLAELQGFVPGDDGYKEMMREAQAQLHETVVNSVVDQDPEKAKAYLEQHKGEVSKDRLDNLNRTIAERSSRKAGETHAQQVAQVAMEFATEVSNTGLPMTQQLAAVQAAMSVGRLTGEEARSAIDQIKEFDGIKKQERKEADDFILNGIEQEFRGNDKLSIESMDPKGKFELERLGLMGRVREIERTVRAQRTADEIAKGKDTSHVAFDRKYKDVDAIKKTIEMLEGLYFEAPEDAAANDAEIKRLEKEQALRAKEAVKELTGVLGVLEAKDRVDVAPVAPPEGSWHERAFRQLRGVIESLPKEAKKPSVEELLRESLGGIKQALNNGGGR